MKNSKLEKSSKILTRFASVLTIGAAFLMPHLSAAATATQLETLIEDGKTEEAMFEILQDLTKLTQELKINQVITQVQSQHKTNYEQVVTKTETQNSSLKEGGSFMFLWFDLSANRDYTYSSTRQETQWILKNPEAVATKEKQLEAKNAEVSYKLTSYVNQNLPQIRKMKTLLALAYYTASKMPLNTYQQSYETTVEQIYQQSQKLVFKGEHVILDCLSHSYAATHQETSSQLSEGVKIDAMPFLLPFKFLAQNIFSVGSDSSSQSKITTQAYTDSQCNESTKTQSVDAQSIAAVQLIQADQAIATWKKHLAVMKIVDAKPGRVPLSFGLY